MPRNACFRSRGQQLASRPPARWEVRPTAKALLNKGAVPRLARRLCKVRSTCELGPPQHTDGTSSCASPVKMRETAPYGPPTQCAALMNLVLSNEIDSLSCRRLPALIAVDIHSAVRAACARRFRPVLDPCSFGRCAGLRRRPNDPARLCRDDGRRRWLSRHLRRTSRGKRS